MSKDMLALARFYLPEIFGINYTTVDMRKALTSTEQHNQCLKSVRKEVTIKAWQ